MTLTASRIATHPTTHVAAGVGVGWITDNVLGVINDATLHYAHYTLGSYERNVLAGLIGLVALLLFHRFGLPAADAPPALQAIATALEPLPPIPVDTAALDASVGDLMGEINRLGLYIKDMSGARETTGRLTVNTARVDAGVHAIPTPVSAPSAGPA